MPCSFAFRPYAEEGTGSPHTAEEVPEKKKKVPLPERLGPSLQLGRDEMRDQMIWKCSPALLTSRRPPSVIARSSLVLPSTSSLPVGKGTPATYRTQPHTVAHRLSAPLTSGTNENPLEFSPILHCTPLLIENGLLPPPPAPFSSLLPSLLQ